MRAAKTLFPILAAGYALSACTSSRLQPDSVRRMNAAYEKMDAPGRKSGKPERDAAAIERRLWGDVPEYAKLLDNGEAGGKAPRLVSAVAPNYPFSAKISGVEARVVVAIVINEKGEVEQARVIESSDQRFDQSAIKASKRYKFLPALGKQGKPVKAFTYLPFRFVTGTAKAS